MVLLLGGSILFFAQTLQRRIQLIQGETVKYEKCLSYNLINIKLAKLHLLSLKQFGLIASIPIKRHAF